MATKISKTLAKKSQTKPAIANPMALPRLDKIVINTGIGRFQEEKDRELIMRNLELLAGQKTTARQAKKSIAGLKIRQGAVVGYKVTLRRGRMKDFLQKLVNVALPRMRDFQGIDALSVDEKGNLTIGVPEYIIFPEIVGEETRIIFGLEITLVPKAKNREEAIELYKALQIPFKQN